MAHEPAEADTAAAEFLTDGPRDSRTVLVLAHGAGAGMDTPFMAHFARELGAGGVRVVRFEFPYMQRRRSDGKRRPPDRMPVLTAAFTDVVAKLRAELRPEALFIGGKSMGGRVASMIADEVQATGAVCLGYPFHPAGRPDSLRTEHLERLRTPTLIVQGTRDPLGSRDEVSRLRLSPAIAIFWCEDGDHDLRPRRASGRTADDNLEAAAARIRGFVAAPTRGGRP